MRCPETKTPAHWAGVRRTRGVRSVRLCRHAHLHGQVAAGIRARGYLGALKVRHMGQRAILEGGCRSVDAHVRAIGARAYAGADVLQVQVITCLLYTSPSPRD